MERSKSFSEKPNTTETNEVLLESIEQALALLTELQQFDGLEVVGGEAMTLNARAEELAGELKTVLERIPANYCAEYGLPYHPSDKKPYEDRISFPVTPDYPLAYPHQLSDEGYPRVDAEQIV